MIKHTENIEIAFRKLQSHIYFDKNDLHQREALSNWIDGLDDKGISKKLLELNKKINDNELSEYFKSISLKVLPKKISTKEYSFKTPSNFYTNNQLTKNSEIDKLAIFINLPIELHIVSVLWLMIYGPKIERKIKKNNFGNRLFLNESGSIGNGRILFKPYQEQFQKWWNKAVEEAKALLEKEENVTILNLDFKSFFHTVKLNFDELNDFLGIKEDLENINVIHDTIFKIHQIYLEKIKEFGFTPALHEGGKSYPLPIGLLTSHPIANWYMNSFDDKINDELNPVYYGRYVDDILIVLKDRVLDNKSIENFKLEEYDGSIKSLHDAKENELKLKKIKEDESYIVKVFFQKYLSNVFSLKASQNKIDDVNIYKVTQDINYPCLELQTSKVAIYQFNKDMSPNLISKFVKEQEKRNYIFQFLSDNTDEMFNEFEVDAFEESLEESNSSHSKFKPQDLNKFRFSVFMAKLIKRKILNGDTYKAEEIIKIQKYFKGIYLLQNFNFWEKILTLYVVSDEINLFFKTVKLIQEEIESVQLIESNYESEFNDKVKTTSIVKTTLKEHLKYSMQMALGLNPLFFNDKKNIEYFKPYIKNKENELLLNKALEINEIPILGSISLEYINIFRRNGFLRNSYVFYPLTQFHPNIKSSIQPLHNSNLFKLYPLINFKIEFQKEYIPYRIKFYDIALFHIYSYLYFNSEEKCVNSKRWYQKGVISSNKYLTNAMNDFNTINHVSNPKINEDYIKMSIDVENDSCSNDKCGEFHIKNRQENFFINQIYIPNGGAYKGNLRIATINKYVDLKHFEQSLEGNVNLTPERVQSYLWILDEVKKVPKCDLFVLPELALPHSLLPTYISKVAHNQIGFISGVEHWKINNIGYNFVITVLPVSIDGDNDAIPVIRLKNHYAPEEEEWINEKNMIVPKPLPYRYDLFIWKGVYFSTYYCYELADIYHRYALFGKTDIMFASVWNKDTNFYNNIVEVISRDMHNYVVIANTSQYGDSRVVRPTNSIRKDKSRVTGGTVNNYQVTLSVSDIKIDELREFQSLNYSGQKKDGRFKPTPPDFPIEDIKTRIEGKPFELKTIQKSILKSKDDLSKLKL